MSALVIRDVPAVLHLRLKRLAARNRRSVAQQAVLLLEKSVRASECGNPKRIASSRLPKPVDLTDPAGGKALMTQAMLRRAIRTGRA